MFYNKKIKNAVLKKKKKKKKRKETKDSELQTHFSQV